MKKSCSENSRMDFPSWNLTCVMEREKLMKLYKDIGISIVPFLNFFIIRMEAVPKSMIISILLFHLMHPKLFHRWLLFSHCRASFCPRTNRARVSCPLSWHIPHTESSENRIFDTTSQQPIISKNPSGPTSLPRHFYPSYLRDFIMAMQSIPLKWLTSLGWHNLDGNAIFGINWGQVASALCMNSESDLRELNWRNSSRD